MVISVLWLCALHYLLLPSCASHPQVPAASDCRTCLECHAASLNQGSARSTHHSYTQHPTSEDADAETHASSFAPQPRAWDHPLIPVCQQCYGCNTQLTSLQDGFKVFNSTFSLEPPMSSASTRVFKATTDALPQGQEAVVKVFCVPPDSESSSDLLTIGRDKACSAQASKRARLVMALSRIAQDCGMGELLPKVWVANVTSVTPRSSLPGHSPVGGRVISWNALWAERAQGLSMRTFLVNSQLPPPLIMDVMQRKLNSTQVVLAAIFDVLTSQRDRHAKNIFLDDNGNIKLIDLEDALGLQWTYWGLNSVLIPTTQRHETIRRAKGKERLTQLLDYRCQLSDPSQGLGTNYPPVVTQCLNKISHMRIKELKELYQLPSRFQTHMLKTRAKDMLHRGFEWTYQYGKPRNYPAFMMPFRKDAPPPMCCQFEWSESGGFECAHPVNL